MEFLCLMFQHVDKLEDVTKPNFKYNTDNHTFTCLNRWTTKTTTDKTITVTCEVYIKDIEEPNFIIHISDPKIIRYEYNWKWKRN